MMRMLWGFIQKEFKQTLRDKRMRVLLFLAPCIQMILFGIALTTEARNIRLAVASSAADDVLDDIRAHALASGWFIDAGRDGAADPFALVKNGHADVVLVPPAGGLTKAMGKGTGTLQVLIDATNVTRAQSIERYLIGIVNQELQTVSGQRRIPPLDFDLRILYNPTLRSAAYMVPGVMSLVMCLTTIILTSMGIAREKEMGTFETIIAAPMRSIEVILGKAIPYVMLGLVNLPLILGVAVLLFDVPLRGSFLLLMGGSLVFICATVTIGILISTLAKTQQQALMGGFLFLFTSILLSGLIFPVENMPAVLQVVAWCNPLTYYMELLRNIMLKGGDPFLMLRNTAVLAVMALLFGVVSIRRFRTTL
ncbi:ABC transporter permease [Oligoflexus tunisiensis]|uniref:ABC transporter permease n=1 Tax=Oligoflexus tunisiensis TaxID=708132 RepID=UPI000A804A9F|nr:ABC transporter permease [Oligoflexus tunisiensis]